MQEFKNILATVDTRFDEHPALQWAVRLALHNESKLKIVEAVPEFPWVARLAMPDHEDAREALIQEKGRRLEALAESIREAGIDVATKVLSGKTSVEVIREVMRAEHDLVVRMTKRAHSRRAGFIGTTSMQLLRRCPCPVWLVRPNKTPQTGQVLAAVGLSNPEETRPPVGDAHDRLSGDIVELAMSIAKYENGQCHVAHAWELFGDSVIKSRMPPEKYEAVEKTVENQVANAFDSFLAPFGLNVRMDEVHLLKGDASLVIPKLVKQKDIDLIVMATIARTGIPGMIMGNTAERMLDRVECSILAIKPEGFVSPVTLDEA